MGGYRQCLPMTATGMGYGATKAEAKIMSNTLCALCGEASPNCQQTRAFLPTTKEENCIAAAPAFKQALGQLEVMWKNDPQQAQARVQALCNGQ